MKVTDHKVLGALYRKYSREHIYSYEEHVELCKKLDEQGKLPAVYMIVPPASWNIADVWDDINRMKTLNTEQSRRRQQLHVCPLQLEIVERIINRFSNKNELVYDPFGGIGTVPYEAILLGRKGIMCELNPDYFRDALGYLENAETDVTSPTLFDYLGIKEA
jgi:DNA modification methylase